MILDPFYVYAKKILLFVFQNLIQISAILDDCKLLKQKERKKI